MQVMRQRTIQGMQGIPQDIVKGANDMLGSAAIDQERWPYWWSYPRSQAQDVQAVNSIPTPASATLTEVVSLQVPSGFLFILKSIRQNFFTSTSPSPFVEGSGDILWTIDVDLPIGASSFAGYGIPYLQNMADERGSKLGPWPVQGYLVFQPYQTIRYKVITTADIPVGAPNFITCGLFGWYEKQI